jgi:hypothetical protein
MASFDLSTMDTVPGALMAVATQENRRTDGMQWLTEPLGPSRFHSQTAPVQAMAAATMLLEFESKQAFTDDGTQVFERRLPTDQLDLIGRLTAVVGVPSIANQTSTAVTKTGVDGGVASITFPPLTNGIDAFDSLAIGAGFLVADFPNGETRDMVLVAATVATGSGFAGTITRTSAVEDVSSFSITITASGTGYTEGDAVDITWDGGNPAVNRLTATLSAATDYDGTAVTISLTAPASGATATATATRVPADAAATAVGFDITITNPGYGYTSAPTVTFTGGGFTGAITGTATLTSATTGENLRYIVPGASAGAYQTAFPASDSDAGTATNVGTAVLVESDVDKTYGNVAKAISGLDFAAAAADSNYHNSLDGAGCQDIAAYFTPYAGAMLFEEVKLVVNGYQYLDGCIGEQILQDGLVYAAPARQPGRKAHFSRDPRLLKRWSSEPHLKWYVTFPLLTQNLRSLYPAAAARTCPVKLVCKTRRWTDLICNGTGGTFAGLENSHQITVSGQVASTVKIAPASTAAASAFLAPTNPATTSAGTAVAYGDFSMQLLVEGFVVGAETRAALQTQATVIPFVQHGYQKAAEPVDPIVTASKEVVVDIETAMPVAALHWAGRLKSSELQHKWADFSAPGDPLTATDEFPLGVPRPPFVKCQVTANGHKELSLPRPADHFLEPQQQAHGKCVVPGLHFFSHHFCAESPVAIQHSSYLDAGTLQKFQVAVQPDPRLFADNTAVRGLNGKKAGSGISVTGGQQVTFRYWWHGRNFLLLRNGAAQVLFR